MDLLIGPFRVRWGADGLSMGWWRRRTPGGADSAVHAAPVTVGEPVVEAVSATAAAAVAAVAVADDTPGALTLTCPLSAVPGEQAEISSPDGVTSYLVTVPAGVAAGQQFDVCPVVPVAGVVLQEHCDGPA